MPGKDRPTRETGLDLVVPAPAEVTPEPAPSPDYTIVDWAGHPNYKCARCSFATLDGEAVIREHLRVRHGR
jgi:hypothetical protein